MVFAAELWFQREDSAVTDVHVLELSMFDLTVAGSKSGTRVRARAAEAQSLA